MESLIGQAAAILKSSRFTTAFTGAGISVESGIPSFRGSEGLWNKYDPKLLEIGYFYDHPHESWKVIREIFYSFFNVAKPNRAHLALARMEREGLLARIITQNIDNLHQEAGSHSVYEFHGNSNVLVCINCTRSYPAGEIDFNHLPPVSHACGGVLKPNFIFFGEGIPQIPMMAAYEAAEISDVFLIIGTTGEVMPANQFPQIAKSNGATIIEINPEPSLYTPQITDIFLMGKAGEVMEKVTEALLEK